MHSDINALLPLNFIASYICARVRVCVCVCVCVRARMRVCVCVCVSWPPQCINSIQQTIIIMCIHLCVYSIAGNYGIENHQI